MIYRVVEFSERTATGHVYVTLLGWLFGTSYGVRTRHPFRFYLPHSALCYRIIPGLIILHFGVNWFILEIYLQKDKCTVWLFVIYRKRKKKLTWEKEDEMISLCTAGQFLWFNLLFVSWVQSRRLLLNATKRILVKSFMPSSNLLHKCICIRLCILFKNFILGEGKKNNNKKNKKKQKKLILVTGSAYISVHESVVALWHIYTLKCLIHPFPKSNFFFLEHFCYKVFTHIVMQVLVPYK